MRNTFEVGDLIHEPELPSIIYKVNKRFSTGTHYEIENIETGAVDRYISLTSCVKVPA